MKQEVILKRALFGGFDRRDVITYIARLHEELNDSRDDIARVKELEATVADLQYKLAEKERMLSDMRLNGSSGVVRSSESTLEELVGQIIEYSNNCSQGLDTLANGGKCTDELKEKVMRVASSFASVSDTITDLMASAEACEEPNEEIEPSREKENLTEENADTAVEPTEDSIPSEEDMEELFKQVKKKYKSMLRDKKE